MSNDGVVFLGIDIGIRNLSYCQIRISEKTKTIERWGLVSILDNDDDNVKDLCSSDIHNLCAYKLPQFFTDTSTVVTHVCIEQQPGGKYANPKPMLVSHLVYHFFHAKLMNIKRNDKLQSVQFVAPSRKYQPSWLKSFNEQKQSKYACRKQLSVRLCANLINKDSVDNSSGITLEMYKKSDDLADSFLLAYTCAYSNLLLRNRGQESC